MQTYRWKRVGTRLMSGLAACLMTASLFAQAPAAVGVVRISDRPRRSYSPSQQVRQTSLTRGQQVDAQRCCSKPPTPSSRFVTATNNWLASPAFGSGNSSCQQGCAEKGCSSCQQEATCQECNSCEQGCSDGSCGSNSVGRGFDKVDHLLDRYFAFEHKCKRCLFGYFMPDGCCGKGCAPKGHYNLLYSANPNYFDQRDGRVYAAQGYGVPMAVPLAPTVRHTYNYGHGIPSSRLTPIFTPAPF